MEDLEKILAVTLTGMSVDEFRAKPRHGSTAPVTRGGSAPYTELAYQPMQELLSYFRANGYKTYIVTGGGQDFVRVYAERVYGIPPEQVVGTAGATSYSYGKDGKPFLTKEPKLLLNDNKAGKPEGIHLMIGAAPSRPSATRPATAMLEYAGGSGTRLAMLVLHDGARVRLRPGAGCRLQGRHVHPGAL